MLFDDLEQKEQLIGLLDDVREAEGVRIFIGAETRLFSLSGSAVIAAPYMSGRQQGAGRDRRDRSRAPQLCPGDPAGGLHRPGAGPDDGRMSRKR